MYTVLVTGANGFVGRPLCEALLAEGWHVRGAVRSFAKAVDLPRGVTPAIIPSLHAHEAWFTACRDVDTVVHLAARSRVKDEQSPEALARYRSVNVAGTKRLASMAAAAGVRRFVYLSTVKVMGECGDRPFTENDQPAPRDAFAQSKWEAEQALRKIEADAGLEVVILRPPLVYGPGVKANFRRLMFAVMRGIPLPLASTQNLRSLIYLGNLVDAIVECIAVPRATGQTYLVSDDDDVSTSELLRRVGTALERPARLVRFPVPLLRMAGQVFHREDTVDRLVESLIVNCRKIRTELGWAPPFSMQVGLQITAERFRDEIARKRHHQLR